MYYFIVNESGGGGNAKKTWHRVTKYLANKNISYQAFITNKKGDGKDFAKLVCKEEDNDKRIVVVGGDGTINEVLNGLYEAFCLSSVKFAVIPTGSGNDFVRGLKLKGSTEKILQNILNCTQVHTMDLGLVTESRANYVFGISAGIGMDAIVCKKVAFSKLKKILNKIHLGSLIYIILTIQTLFSMKTNSVKVIIDDKEEIDFERLIFIAFMNCAAEGGGVPMCPKASFIDGLLSICAASGIAKLKAFFDLPFLVLGKQHKLKGFTLRDCKRIEFFSDSEIVLHTDGEYISGVKNARLECIPSCLQVLM